MRPLTIDELRALKAGDWVWVIIKQPVAGDFPHDGRYYQSANYEFMKNKNKGHVFNGYSGFYPYSAYGKKWIAYKNKEQAECKGEIVELPCKAGDTVYRLHKATKEIVKWEIESIKLSKGETIFTCGHSGTEDYCVFGDMEIGEDFFTDKPQAEARLKELRGEK